MQGVRRHIVVATLASIGLAGAFYAGIAYAADARLDEADAAVQKAIALLEAAQNPGVQPPFGGHREKAIHDLKKAREQIQKAKEYSDKHPPNDKNKDKAKGKDKHKST